MNQMIGAAATAMSNVFGVTVDIEPPRTKLVADLINADHAPLMTDKPVVVARFEVNIGNLFKTTFMQISDVYTAREEANFLLMKAGIFDAPDGEDTDVQPVGPGNALGLASPYVFQELPNLTGVLAVPSEVVFALGRLQWTMGDVARLHVGGEMVIKIAQVYGMALTSGLIFAL